MSDASAIERDHLAVLRGKTSEIIAGISTSTGVASGATAAVLHAEFGWVLALIVTPQLHTVLLLAMRWTRQRHEHAVQRLVLEEHRRCFRAALENPADPDLRTLMDDYVQTSPYRPLRDDLRLKEQADAAARSDPCGPRPAGPPPLTPIDRSA